MLVVIPGAESVRDMVKTLREVKASGAAAHIGANYYLKGTRKRALRVDQNRDAVKKVVTCVGAFLHTVAPGCTLASSPAFTDTLEEAIVLC